MKTMKAAQLNGIENIVISEVEIPEVGPKDILLKVQCCAICGSDLHNYYEGPYKPGQIMGHEFIGTVCEVGSEVEDIEIGMRGTGYSMKTCGECIFCKSGKSNLCPDLFDGYSGYGFPGAFAEYMHIREAKLGVNFLLVPESISDEEAALIEPTGVAAVADSRTKIRPDQNVIIQGAGPLGNLTAQILKAKKPACLVVTDVLDFRLDLIKQLNAADYCIKADQDVEAEVKKIWGEGHNGFGTNGNADVIIDCSGNAGAIAQAFELARNGASICQVGIASKASPINTRRMTEKSLSYFGFAASNMPKAIKLISEGVVQLKPLITHVLPLEEINEGFRIAKSDKNAMKVVIKID